MGLEFPALLTSDQLERWCKANGLQPMTFGTHSPDAMCIMKNGHPTVLAVYRKQGGLWLLDKEGQS